MYAIRSYYGLSAAIGGLALGCADEAGLSSPSGSQGLLEQGFRHPPPPGDGPWPYNLTCYGGPNDSSAYLGTPACGGRVVDGAWWYATGAWSFHCHAKLELRRGDRCCVVEVVDNGPAEWVRNNFV